MSKQIIWNDLVSELYNERGFINICYEALDKHPKEILSKNIAIRFIPENWSPENKIFIDLTYEKLQVETCKFAHVLKLLGVEKGDHIFSLSPRIPEFYITALGALRVGVVFCPLFSSFGPDPIKSRMNKGRGKVLFTLSSLYRKKILPIRDELIDLVHVILINDDENINDLEDVIDFHEAMKNSPSTLILEKTLPDDPALLHFTSGTTGEPKGAVHPHKSVVYHKASGEFALDLRTTDQLWCTADPGWVTGTSYGLISPLCIGSTILVDGSDFNAKRWFEILEKIKIDVWYTSPTALRMLMKMKQNDNDKLNLSQIRFSATVGEPLNPQIIEWARHTLQITLHDNWWQTETGGIMICNDAGSEIKLGSMGRPVPGIEVKIIKSIKNSIIEFGGVGEKGEIAIKNNWPSIFNDYLGNTEKYQKCFVEDWYLSGDLAYQDHDGYFWFVGRMDDVIKTSGHLVGPFEIENILMGFEAVLESAVIGIPDLLAGEMIKAFVVLKSGYNADAETQSKILAFCRKRLGVAISPREIQFIDNLPKTRSGKIMRRLLKARELGLPEGDLSTLEGHFDAR